MKKQLSSIFAVILLLAVWLSGCGRRTPPEQSPDYTPIPTPTVDPHEGEVEVLRGGGGTMWVPECPDLEVFGYTATDFDVVDQIPYYNGDQGLTLRRGIDVSDHQQEIDWQAVADYGIQFAIIRCGYRSYGADGEIHPDGRFQENIEGALAAGLDVGVYFFSQAVNIVEAAEEAIFAIHAAEDYNVTLPIFFDWETVGVDTARSETVDGQTVTACCLEFCKLVQAAGYEPGMYCYNAMGYYTYQLNELTGITFWMGDTGTKPIFYYDHDFWQYSFTARIPGIGVDVDLDAMYIRPGTDTPAAAVPSPDPAAVLAPTITPSINIVTVTAEPGQEEAAG